MRIREEIAFTEHHSQASCCAWTSKHPECHLKPSRVPHGLPLSSGEPSTLPFCHTRARHQVGSRKVNPDPRGLFPGWAGEEGCKSCKGENLRLISDTTHDDQINCQRSLEVTLAWEISIGFLEGVSFKALEKNGWDLGSWKLCYA